MLSTMYWTPSSARSSLVRGFPSPASVPSRRSTVRPATPVIPQTGERVRVKKTSVPRFRAGQGFKDLVSGSKKLPRGGEVSVKKAPKGSLTGGAGATVKKAAAKKATTKTAAAKKTTAKKTTAKKATTKTAAAKKTTAKKAPAKKTTTAKTTAAKKTTAKKAPAKKATAKKAPAKKSTARKTTAKKTTARKK
ncbi:DNA-binding protein HU-beta [Streptomyces africanus]|uniref:DNA-binding protein HU-beta n=1 Tax=Streptomyces africanus TaxID=231024 RepID=A0ABU0QVW2_9ACTN|nr:DNA-binding protein HU-beta [Streptomyces africanus]